MTWLYVALAAVAAVYILIGAVLAAYGSSQGEPFKPRTVYAWPLVVLGR